MNYRKLGRTGWSISEVSFGAWAIEAHGEMLMITHRLKHCIEP